jgi:hypothetical protein
MKLSLSRALRKGGLGAIMVSALLLGGRAVCVHSARGAEAAAAHPPPSVTANLAPDLYLHSITVLEPDDGAKVARDVRIVPIPVSATFMYPTYHATTVRMPPRVQVTLGKLSPALPDSVKHLVTAWNRYGPDVDVTGDVRINLLEGNTVHATNIAKVYSSCSHCSAIAVALQINLIKNGSGVATLENTVIADNVNCVQCFTAGIALQYSFFVDDPKMPPPEVQQLIQEMNHDFGQLTKHQETPLATAQDRVNALLAEFRSLKTTFVPTPPPTAATRVASGTPQATAATTPDVVVNDDSLTLPSDLKTGHKTKGSVLTHR